MTRFRWTLSTPALGKQAGPSSLPRADDVRVISGRGVTAVNAGRRFTAGSPRFAREDLGAIVGTDGEEGTRTLVWSNGLLLGRLRFAEALRPETPSTLNALTKLGLWD